MERRSGLRSYLRIMEQLKYFKGYQNIETDTRIFGVQSIQYTLEVLIL